MRWSIKIGRILGINVYVHLTFLLLLAFVGFSNWMQHRMLGSAINGVLFLMSLFLCVLLHEFGHALAARRYGIGTHDITLLPIGGIARLERMPDKPSQELLVAIAGPLVNVVIAGGLLIGLVIKGNWQLSPQSMFTGSVIDRLIVINVLLVVFNMLPAFPMDGGRVLRALLAFKLTYGAATRIAATIGQAMAVVFAIVGLFFWFNPFLLLIALFVWMGASQEAAAIEMKSSMSGATVKDAMLTHFRSLSPGQTLGEAVRQLLAGSQQDFPVLEDGRVAGILFRKDLLNALPERGENVPISTVMHRDFDTLEAGDLLDNALANVRADKGMTTVAVMSHGEFVGLLTAENVGEYLMVRAALERGRGHRGAGAGVGAPPIMRDRVTVGGNPANRPA